MTWTAQQEADARRKIVPLFILGEGRHFTFVTADAFGTVVRRGDSGVTVSWRHRGESQYKTSRWSTHTMVVPLAKLPEAKDETDDANPDVIQVRPGDVTVPAGDRRGSKTDDDAPKRTRFKGEMFGHAVTSVIRWMGKQGWTFEQAREALELHDCERVNDTTVKIQLAAGRKGDRGPAADLTEKQVSMLEKIRQKKKK